MTYGPLYFIKSQFNGRVLDVEEGSTEVIFFMVDREINNLYHILKKHI